jgi:hypothetical protein
VLVLLVDAALLELASEALPDYISIDSPAAALVIAVVSLVLQVMIGANNDDAYSLRGCSTDPEFWVSIGSRAARKGSERTCKSGAGDRHDHPGEGRAHSRVDAREPLV